MNGEEPGIASYFFWINGTQLQRSQEGLLRSLLSEILTERPDLAEIAFPHSLGSFKTNACGNPLKGYAWTRAELLDTIKRLASSSVTAPRVCIFIDGLDEYDGDPDELIDTIRNLETMKIRMCIASRPWNVFEEAFSRCSDRKLYIHELNKPDIKLYDNDKLRSREEFQNLHIRTPDADEVVAEIVEKSQGVFLWVVLVVRSLIEGLRNRDRLSQLQKRLMDFPSDLKPFFDQIFRPIDPIYRV